MIMWLSRFFTAESALQKHPHFSFLTPAVAIMAQMMKWLSQKIGPFTQQSRPLDYVKALQRHPLDSH